jgi:hypothetical protein
MGRKRGVTPVGGAGPNILVAPKSAKTKDSASDLDDSEFDGAEFSISSDESPSGSDVDDAEREEETEHDAELRDALIDYQTTAARLREEEASGRTNGDDDDAPG